MTRAVLYFAYGSNMLTERLAARCASARAMGAATLDGHGLRFSKPGADRSGKATPVAAAGEALPGVLFTISAGDLSALDRIEGVGSGYDRVRFTVRDHATNEPVEAVSYLASRTDEALKPYDWYRALVLAGALEHALPAAHQGAIRAVDIIHDTDEKSAGRREAIAALARAGFAHLM